jgi:hypothetical protein
VDGTEVEYTLDGGTLTDDGCLGGRR